MEQEGNSTNKNNDWWRPVMMFYVKTTSWIIFPLALAVFTGKYVEKSIGSQALSFVFVLGGFVVTCLGIYWEIKKYKKNLDKN